MSNTISERACCQLHRVDVWAIWFSEFEMRHIAHSANDKIFNYLFTLHNFSLCLNTLSADVIYWCKLEEKHFAYC